jgi:hypothetical protein
MSKSEYSVGMLIEVPRRPEWGPGKVVGMSHGGRLHVYFRDSLEKKAKTLLTDVAKPTVAAIQSDEVLDALPAATQDGSDWMLPKNYEKLMARARAK